MSQHVRFTVLRKPPPQAPVQKPADKEFVPNKLTRLIEKAKLAALEEQRAKEQLAIAQQFADLRKEAIAVIEAKIKSREISFRDVQKAHDAVNQCIITHTRFKWSSISL